MLKYMLFWSGAILIGYGSLCVAQQNRNVRNDPSEHHETLNQYCVVCHNDTAQIAGLSLERADIGNVGTSRDVWEKVLRKLRTKSMPPSGMPRPEDTVYQGIADYLQTELNQYAQINPDPGRPIIRRMNRTEYMNAIRDLLAVEVQEEVLFADDDTMQGFDKIGDVLTLSPLLAEQYISAASKIRRRAIGESDIQPVFEIYTVSANLLQGERVSEDLPFGSRGGVAIRHYFPLDGEYVLQVRLQRNSREYIRGLQKPHKLDLRLDGVLVHQFTIGGEKHGRSAGIFSTGASGDVEQEHYERTADESLEVRFFARAGTRLVSVAFLKERAVPEEPQYPRHTAYDYAQYKGGDPAVHTVSIGGPYNPQGMSDTDSRERIFICQPVSDDDESCARRILHRLAYRAYRRTPTMEEMGYLFDFYMQGQKQGGFEAGIGLALERILAGPEFLFLTERDPEGVAPGEVYQITPLELASRMSFFLWSSIPDATLLELAESGMLMDPEVLEQQVHRMLGDRRSQSLVDNFASQWLGLRVLNAASPDTELFPYFEDNLRLAFQEETRYFFEYVFREDRPLLELLDADYTFLNERLARHYGISNIYGSHFRRVSLPDDTRGGLLSQGSILTATSYANRTSPVIRGKWVLENILSDPPPAPPADVPGLVARNQEGKVLTMREQMEQHRANPVCASCHKVMDPLGFALENYDAIGTWRVIDGASKSSIDSKGALPDGTTFEGPVELREVLIQKRREDFVMTVIEKLLTYALGREINYADIPVARSIMKKAEPEHFHLSSLILAIIKSMPFQMRRASNHADP